MVLCSQNLERNNPLIPPSASQNPNIDADAAAAESRVKTWITECVIGLSLCPFARKEFDQDNIRFKVSDTHSDKVLLTALASELELLHSNSGIETSILIIRNHLREFLDYCDFIELANSLLLELSLEGQYQIAGFHPEYQFAGTEACDAENYTNRSPYPLLHILREASVEKAIKNHPDANGIPARNIERMNDMGTKKLRELFSKF